MASRRDVLLGSAAAGVAIGTATGTLAAAETRVRGARSARKVRVFELGEQSGIESLRLVERPAPTPARDEAIVRVRFSSINARDIGITQGIFLGKKPANRIPLSEGAGEVIAVGEGVGNVRIGDRVTGCHYANWQDGAWHPANFDADIGSTLDGWLGEEVALPARTLVKLPDNVSDETAATLASSAVTAWHALNHVAQVLTTRPS